MDRIMPDTRGTGQSADASDPLSYRCDRLAGDVEALRAHLGLDRMDLLGHSAAGDLAVLYAAAHPQRVAQLILLTPGLRAVGLEESDEQWRAALARRSGEPGRSPHDDDHAAGAPRAARRPGAGEVRLADLDGGRPAQRHHQSILARLEHEYGWLTSRWEDIKPQDEGRPRRRYYRLTEDGAERARLALAQARTPVSAMELRVRSAGGWHEHRRPACRRP
jgi:pimeloyl-ACP methyl ester carboxylesterase